MKLYKTSYFMRLLAEWIIKHFTQRNKNMSNIKSVDSSDLVFNAEWNMEDFNKYIHFFLHYGTLQKKIRFILQ